MGALPSCVHLSTKGRVLLAANQWAQSLLDERRSRPFVGLPAPGESEQPPPLMVGGTGIELHARIQYTQVVGYSNSHLRHLLITVSWQERGKTQRVQHETDMVGLEK